MSVDEYNIKISITYKIMLLVIVVVLVAVGISTSLSVRIESKVLTVSLINMANNLAMNIASSTKSAFSSLNWIFVQKQIEDCPNIGRHEVLCVKIVNPDGEVYMSSNKSYYGTIVHSSLLKEKKLLIEDYYFDFSRQKGYLLVHPFKIEEELWHIILELSAEPVKSAIKVLVLRNLMFGGLIVFLAIAGSYFLARSICTPISSLAKVAVDISNGNWRLINIESKDEIGLLGHTFNHMVQTMKAATTKLRYSEEKYRNIFENSTEGIFQISNDGSILTANPAFAKISGFNSPKQLEEKTININEQLHIDPQKKSDFQYLISKRGFIKNFETKIRRKDGQIIDVLINARLVHDEKHNRFYYEGILQDVTRKKQIEALTLEKQSAEAEAEAKSRFLAHMSHEIRTPLNTIIGYSQILRDIDIGGELHDYINSIISSGNQLMSLINNVLDFSRLDTGKVNLNLKPMHINSVFKEIFEQFKTQFEYKRLSFSIDLMHGLGEMFVLVDEMRFRQIISNLIDNAYKFTKAGFIKINVFFEHVNTDSINLTFEIIDTGIGIKNTEAIFKEFEQQCQQSNLIYEGTGLGLSIVKRLVELSGGTITVTSKVEKGSTFTVTIFDLKIVDGHIKEPSVSQNTSIKFREETILIVDDNENNRNLLRDFLREYSLIDIVMATNGRDALERLACMKFSLILLDYKMPIMDGKDLLRIIKADKRLSTIPVIVITADITSKTKKELYEAGCNGYLLKPINKEDLIKEMLRFLDYDFSYNSNNILEQSNCNSNCNSKSKFSCNLNNEDRTKLLKSLYTVKKESFYEAKKTMVIGNIVKLADNIYDLASSYEFLDLMKWSEKLKRYATNCDFIKTEDTLSQFTNFIEIIE